MVRLGQQSGNPENRLSMQRPSSKQRRLVILLLTILTFSIAYYGGNKYSDSDASAPTISGVSLRPTLPTPEFALEDRHGDIFTQAELEGQWNLILLDPNRSSDSAALLRLVQVHNRLAIVPALQQQIRFIYIPLQVGETTEAVTSSLDTGFVTLSGDTERLTETFTRFGVAETTDDYTLYLIDPMTRMHALFTSGQDAATIADDLITLISHQH